MDQSGNASVNALNEEKLSEIEGQLYTAEAIGGTTTEIILSF